MNAPQMDFALQWLEKATNDLITVQHMLTLPHGPTDTPCFHAQQAVEKSLKAWLTAQHIAFSKTHDLMPLLDLASSKLPELESFRTAFAQLSGYAVDVRYPGDFINPSREDVQTAFGVATRVVALIRKKLLEITAETSDPAPLTDTPPESAP